LALTLLRKTLVLEQPKTRQEVLTGLVAMLTNSDNPLMDDGGLTHGQSDDHFSLRLRDDSTWIITAVNLKPGVAKERDYDDL
jgi:hypothetical protein